AAGAPRGRAPPERWRARGSRGSPRRTRRRRVGGGGCRGSAARRGGTGCADSGTSGTSCTSTVGDPAARCAGRDLSVEDRVPGRSGGPEARQFLRARGRAHVFCAGVFPIWNIAAQNSPVASAGCGAGREARRAERPRRSASGEVGERLEALEALAVVVPVGRDGLD